MAEENASEGRPGEAAKASVPWVPLILVLLFIPIITLLLTELVVVPRLRDSMGGDAPAGAASPASASATVLSPTAEHSVVFADIIANLSGTMGTRFMKVSFHVASRDPQLSNLVRMRNARVQDAIITTLSSKTIQELEAVGGRNSLRVALISAINQAIGLDVVQELYFTEFIIQ